MHLLARLLLSSLLTCNTSSSCKLQSCRGKTFNSGSFAGLLVIISELASQTPYVCFPYIHYVWLIM